MLNLLVPVDGSDNANRAVLHARAQPARRPPASTCSMSRRRRRALACPA